HAAVVTELGSREAALRPAKGPRALEERVLLLDTEPGIVLRVLLRGRGQRRAGVRGVRLVRAWQQHLAHDELVRASADWVRTDEHRSQDTVRVLTGCLVGAGSVEAPDARLFAVRDDLRLGAELTSRLRTVDPDVFRLVRH